MNNFNGKDRLSREQAIKACQQLTSTLADPNRLPLEREANYLLAQMLQMQVRELGLLDNPEVQEFLSIVHSNHRPVRVRRFPQDFT